MVVMNEFLLDADKNLNRKTNIKLPNGEYFQLDADLEEMELATQIASIAFVPSIISPEYKNKTPLKKGDLIICHFHVVRAKNEITLGAFTPEGYIDNSRTRQVFRCPYFHLWAKIENETIIPLEEFLFVEPIIEDKSELFCGQFQVKLEQGFLHKRGRVIANSVLSDEAGIKLNDTVIVTQNAECEIELFGRTFWRLRIRNVVGIERNAELICMAGKVLVKEQRPEIKQGGFELPEEITKERRGTVLLSDLPGTAPGDNISFHHGIDTAFQHKGEQHAYIDRENFNYIINQ